MCSNCFYTIIANRFHDDSEASWHSPPAMASAVSWDFEGVAIVFDEDVQTEELWLQTIDKVTTATFITAFKASMLWTRVYLLDSAKIDRECRKSQWMIFKDIERKCIKRKPTKDNMLIFSRLCFYYCWKRISEEASHLQFQLANLYHKVKVWSNAIEVVSSLEPSLPTFRIKWRSFAIKKNKLQL